MFQLSVTSSSTTKSTNPYSTVLLQDCLQDEFRYPKDNEALYALIDDVLFMNFVLRYAIGFCSLFSLALYMLATVLILKKKIASWKYFLMKLELSQDK